MDSHDESAGTAVRLARPDEVDRLAQNLASAFESDPMMRWFIPSDARWGRGSVRLFAWYTARRVRNGTAYTTTDHRGAALWDDPEHVHMTASEQMSEAAMVARVFGATLGRAVRGDRLMKSHHLRFPHWYLHIIGVDAELRGRGVGSSLLQPVLSRCDQSGTPAYLEASSSRNRALYERHGFEVIEEIRFPKGPPYFAMVRSPRG